MRLPGLVKKTHLPIVLLLCQCAVILFKILVIAVMVTKQKHGVATIFSIAHVISLLTVNRFSF